MRLISSLMKRFGSERKPDLGAPAEGGVVMMAPNAWFPSMLSGPAIAAKVLAERGHKVDLLSCGGVRETCTIMDGMAPEEERPARRFCADCVARSREYVSRYGLTQHFDTDFLDAEALRKLEGMMAHIGEDLRAAEWDGIAIGVFATGNLSAILKRDLFASLTDQHAARLRLMVEDGLRWYLIAQEMYKRLKPKNFSYYAEYYPEVIVGLVLQRHGVRVSPVVHSNLNGNDFRKLLILDGLPQVLETARRLPQWQEWCKVPLKATQVSEVCDDVATKLLGKSPISFSPALSRNAELAAILDALSPDRRTLVAFTSSDDELNNSKMQRQIFNEPLDTSGEIFSDQCAWLSAIAEFVARSESTQLIVRLHPRLGSNSRSSAVAEYHAQVDAVARYACDRIHIILPESKCSSYDLAQQADLVVTSWSSIGLECVRMGLPALMAFRGTGIYPVDSFIKFHTDRAAYFDALENGFDFDLASVTAAYRFHYMYACALAVDLSDLILTFDDSALPEYREPRGADDIEQCIIFGDTMPKRNLQRLVAAADHEAPRNEKLALAAAMRRTIYVLAFGADRSPASIQMSSTECPTSSDPDTLYVVADGVELDLFSGEHRVRSRSKAIRTLLRFHQQLLADADAERCMV